MAARAYFGFPRVTDAFGIWGGDGVGNWLAIYPLSNLGVLPLSRVARSLDATTGSTQIAVSATSAAQSASVLALVGHNLSQAATIDVRIWSDREGTALVYHSGSINAWAASYTADELSGAVWTFVHRFANSGNITVGRVALDITDTANTNGYVQAGFLEIAGAFDVSYNFAFGSQYGFRWRSQVTEAIGGAKYVDDRQHPRIFKGDFPVTLRAESMGKFYEIERQGRSHKPILFVPISTETAHLLRTVMFAQQIDPGPSTMRSSSILGLIDSVPLALEEIIG